MNYGYAECEIQEDGRPPPRAGNWFVAVHGGRTHPAPANSRNLDELYDFNVTLTARVTIPLDRVGDQLIARNLTLVPHAQRQGFERQAGATARVPAHELAGYGPPRTNAAVRQ